MLKIKKKNRKIYHYKKTIYFTNGNMQGDLDTYYPPETLKKHYKKMLKRNCFIERDDGQDKIIVFNSKNIIGIELVEKIEE